MKKLWYKIVRFFVSIGLHSSFKEIKAINATAYPDNEAFLFVANHRNGLIDPILIAVTQTHIFHFLTRASAFKNPLANFLLRSINMLPIFRIRDGKNSIQKNQAIFEACYRAFNQRESVLIFAEGNHGLPRRVRPLSKGFTRIAFGYLDQNPSKKLKIIPVGLNYSNMHHIGSSVHIYYGQSILVNDYYNPKKEKEAIDSLKDKVYQELQKLTTHIEDLEQHGIIEKNLIAQGVDFLNPNTANQLIRETTQWEKPVNLPEKGRSILQVIISLLFRLNTFFPIMIWKILQKKVKDIVLQNTYKFGLSMVLIPLTYLIQSGIVSYFFGFQWGLLYLICSIIILLIYKNTVYTDNRTT